MKCLFVRHPFAGWIVDGVKRIEYRTRLTRIRGKIGIIQSRSNCVIGTAEITGCEWNRKLEHFEWQLANAVRFAEPFPFRHKNGAVVWIEVDVPQTRNSAPQLPPEEFAAQKAVYEAKIASWLHPEKAAPRFFVVFKDGSRKAFKSESAMDKFADAHAEIVDYCHILD